MTLAETQELAARARGRPAEPAFAERLYAASEGNPLFVVEMARAGDAPPGADPSAGPRLPAKLHALLQRQLAQLSPAALELGQLAALLGRTVDYAALAAAWPADEASLVEALDELLRRRILYEAAADRYAFTHGQLRAACCASMSRARQGLMQRRIAAALAAA
ncbi:MAG: hypothetical protein BWY52_03365 [Chloroflexi bacterium ADurb.Bin325]|nr:MAG: hypothetical protein BWY52_03365 [Chloroflexi bacterium ADurb.Bin325]